jgi:hypothetical protein
VILLTAGILIGVVLSHGRHPAAVPAHAADATPGPSDELAALRTEIETIKGKLSGQAHVMMDVGYHFNNLWFAAQRGNWPLAKFYLDETRSHLRWAVRVIPVRKDSLGREIQLADILESLENADFKRLEEALAAKDRERFVAAYELTLTGCYACHQASDKAYLTLKVPDHPAEAMIEFAQPAAQNSVAQPEPNASHTTRQNGK